MEQIITYIKPDLLVLVPVLALIGLAIKHTKAVHDEAIPMLLGVVGVGMAILWVVATTPSPESVRDGAMMAFTALIQGVLCAGAAVYSHQLYKQHQKANKGKKEGANT